MPPTRRQLRVSAIFGLDAARSTDVRRAHRAHAHAAARALRAALRPGHIALITGPSGSGKSSLLRALASCHRACHQDRPAAVDDLGAVPRIVRAPRPDQLRKRNRPLIDLFPRLSLDETLRTLARAGLAEARLFMLRPSKLSEGQLHRLSCATAWALASRGPVASSATILLDEFASTLDRPTARALAASLRRAVSRSPHRLIAATAHDDILEALNPDHLVLCAQDRPPAVHTRAGS